MSVTGTLDSHGFELHLGDCLDVMKDIPDGSVDMILADPPYQTTCLKWDSIIPLEPMWKHLRRIIKPNGAIVMTASQPFTTMLIASNMDMFKYCWVWKKTKTGGAFDAKNKPLKEHEDIAVFSGGGIPTNSLNKMVYYPQGLSGCNKIMTNDKSLRASFGGNRPGLKDNYIQTQTDYLRSIIEIRSEGKTVHPTQKPVPLGQYLIKTYTNEGETVLDFTAGSGSFGVAAILENRKFIGIELDEKYFEIAKSRIEDTIKDKAQQLF